MKEEVKTYIVDGKEYKVLIIRKRIKHSYVKMSKDNSYFIMTTRPLMPLGILDDFVKDAIRHFLKRNIEKVEKPITDSYFYCLGEKKENNLGPESTVKLFLKYKLIGIVAERVRYYEKLMGISEPYKIKVHDNTTRFGSNSRRTHTLSFALCLAHYDEEVIESVVVHELAHHFYFDHSKDFYNVVYKYCPSYKSFRVRLIKRKYGKDC